MVMQGGYNGVEFVLIGLLPCVELDDPSLEDFDEIEEKVVVGKLLLTGCKT